MRAGIARRLGMRREEQSVTVPSMDGALKPNQALEEAEELLRIPAPDNLMDDGARVIFTSGKSLYELTGPGGGARELDRFDQEICCAATSPHGAMAVGLVNGSVQVLGDRFARTISTLGERAIVCPTALTFSGPSTLIVCIGSDQNGPSHWRRDLLQRGNSGSVWKIDLVTGAQARLAGDLAFPCGLLEDPAAGLVVSEAWKHRLIAIGPGERTSVLIDELPGYPGRIARIDRGSLLCVFAPRRQIVEFVIREKAYLQRMMAEVHEDFWMAPTLSSGKDFREPLLGGAVKQLGILKPWAPTMSYGLIVRLDAAYQPVESYHSRADGTRHGVTSCLQRDGSVLFASKGGDVLCRFQIADEVGEAA